MLIIVAFETSYNFASDLTLTYTLQYFRVAEMMYFYRATLCVT